METSVRKALKFAEPAGSVEARFQKVGMTAVPKSLRVLMNIMSPDAWVFPYANTIDDVSLQATLTLYSNGEFVWTGTAEDDGWILGDIYSLSVSLTQASPDNLTFALSHKGEMEAGGKDSWKDTGNSRWLQDHWDLVLASNARWRMTQRPELGTLIGIIFGDGILAAPQTPSTYPTYG